MHETWSICSTLMAIHTHSHSTLTSQDPQSLQNTGSLPLSSQTAAQLHTEIKIKKCLKHDTLLLLSLDSEKQTRSRTILSSFSSSGSEVTCSSALKYPSCSTEASNERDPLVQPETEKKIV